MWKGIGNDKKVMEMTQSVGQSEMALSGVFKVYMCVL